MHTVHVRYGLSPRAASELPFAADLARRLNVTLFVWIGRDSAAATLIATADLEPAVREEAHIRDRVRAGVGDRLPEGRLRFARGNPADDVHDAAAILVGGRFARAGLKTAAFDPMAEASIDARGAGELCLPFGNGDSGRRAASAALPLAARLGLSVLFYHTTWKEPTVPADAPADLHMDGKARGVHDDIRRLADSVGVSHRSVIETADDIVEGIGKIALAEHCLLVAMARGRNTGRGSYVDRILRRTPIPVFTAGRGA